MLLVASSHWVRIPKDLQMHRAPASKPATRGSALGRLVGAALLLVRCASCFRPSATFRNSNLWRIHLSNAYAEQVFWLTLHPTGTSTVK